MNARLFLLIGLMAGIISGCISAAEPAQIAIFPKTTPIARYPSDITPQYNTTLEIWVSDLEHAVQEAYRLTARYNGFVKEFYNWQSKGRDIATLEIIVPSEYFDSLRLGFLSLGIVASESAVTGRVEPLPIQPGPRFSQITLQLQASRSTGMPLKPANWSPSNTFQRAFGVFMTIFGFIVDLLIWIVVVAGPFLIVGVLIFLLARRWSKSRKTPHAE